MEAKNKPIPTIEKRTYFDLKKLFDKIFSSDYWTRDQSQQSASVTGDEQLKQSQHEQTQQINELIESTNNHLIDSSKFIHQPHQEEFSQSSVHVEHGIIKI
jgi:hypothetical protein